MYQATSSIKKPTRLTVHGNECCEYRHPNYKVEAIFRQDSVMSISVQNDSILHKITRRVEILLNVSRTIKANLVFNMH